MAGRDEGDKVCEHHEKRLIASSQESEADQHPHSLKRLVNRFLETQLSSSSLFAWLELAESYRFHELFLIVEGLICQHFVDLSLTEQFLSVSEARVQWLVQNERLVCSEVFLLEALVRWYKGDVETRKNPIGKLVSFIKLEHIPSNYLKSFIKKNELGEVAPELKSVVEKPRKAKLSLNFSREKKNERNAKYANVVLASYMWKSGANNACRRGRKLLVKYWLPMREYVMTQEFDKGFHHCPHRRYREGGRRSSNLTNPVIINHKLYVLHQGLCQSCKEAIKGIPLCAKCMKTDQLNMFHFHLSCYDLLDGSYKVKAVLNSNPDRAHSKAIAMVNVGFHLFVAEQTFDGYVLFHRYNTENLYDRWESFTLSNHYFHRTPCVAPYGIQSLYVMGSHIMEKFDIFGHKWQSLTPMPLGAPISRLKAVVYKQEIMAAVSEVDYVQTTSKWMVYTPDADEWHYHKTHHENEMTPEETKNCVQFLNFHDCNFVFIFRDSPQECFPVVYRISKKHFRKKLVCKREDYISADFGSHFVYDNTTFAALSRKAASCVLLSGTASAELKGEIHPPSSGRLGKRKKEYVGLVPLI